MEVDAATVAFAGTLVILCISLVGVMIQMNRTLAGIAKEIGALTARVDALAAGVEANRVAIEANIDEQIQLLRTEIREGRRDLDRKLERLRDRVDANAVTHTHDASIKEVGAQVVAFNARVSRVEDYIEATSGGEWPVAGGQ